CIVLGRDFKLLDDANILLRTPRQHNMYSIDLNNIVPQRDLTCLVSKASADECMLWHRRLVNIACYVQNRVLVNKSHNKTPYELFNGRSPAIGFLKPFGCHVMILNTLDNLGKFKEKGDEGYFIGYSMCSKAFRVFNKRTRRVEENLHVEFLENNAIEKGAGPNWLFDIDSLTKSMNYVPAHDALLESSSSKPQDHCSTKVPEGSGNPNPTASTSNPPMEILTVESLIPIVSSPVPIVYSTDSQEPSNILGVTTNLDESNGVEADISNMEIAITTSPTPTLRIHKDHPKSQIIGPLDIPIQTRTSPKRIEAIRLFLAYASFMGFTVYQMDVKSAFLYAPRVTFLAADEGSMQQTISELTALCTSLQRIVPFFETMLVQQGEGSGTPTVPHHTPSPTALPPSPTTHSSPTLPPVTTTSIPAVTP
nr:retrovirus-related Pol polyprotein from transposon TNT 1-94 [Tanacetum cinerariifolium]